MAPTSLERWQRDRIGGRGPFDGCETEKDTLEMANRFLRRSGLVVYAHYFRIGASLAKRSFGTAPQGRHDYQVDYLRKFHETNDIALEATRSRSRRESQSEPKDDLNEEIDTQEIRQLRREEEYRRLEDEGNRKKWQIYRRQTWRVHALVLCCSLGAAIQGWDESAVNGAQLYYKEKKALDIERPIVVGLINSAPYLMCIFSCSLTGPLNRFLGRKGTIMVCCVFCFTSCLGQAFCQTWRQLLLCRLLLGFGIGPKSATVPIYAAESVPSEEIRGALVMSWQLWTAFGIMVGYIFTYVFRDLHDQWRFMLGSPMIAPALLFFLMMSLPESPRWHLLRARELEKRSDLEMGSELRYRLTIEWHFAKAFQALRTLRHTPIQAARDLIYIDAWLTYGESLKHSDSSEGLGSLPLKRWFRHTIELFRQPRCRRAMTAGLIVMALQQLCGVNVLAYYSSSVFKDSLPGSIAHLTDPDQIGNIEKMKDTIALRYSLGFGAINFGIAIPATFMIDYVGRRLLLLTTLPLMAIFQLVTGLTFRDHTKVVTFAYLFCVAYSIGEGPVPLVYASECLPLEVRDTGVGTLTSVYWGLNSLMALTWPSMYDSWRPIGSFTFYAVVNIVGWVFVVSLVPETSQYTLEQLDGVFSKHTLTIVKVGWAQVWWLVSGAGTNGKGSGRWKWENYPRLVPQTHSDVRDNFEQEMDERDGHGSGS